MSNLLRLHAVLDCRLIPILAVIVIVVLVLLVILSQIGGGGATDPTATAPQVAEIAT